MGNTFKFNKAVVENALKTVPLEEAIEFIALALTNRDEKIKELTKK